VKVKDIEHHPIDKMPSHKHQQEESIYNLIPKPPVVQPKAQK
jgi:hypothetical protein